MTKFSRRPDQYQEITMLLPGDPPEVATRIAKRVVIWCHVQHGKEITYEIVDKLEFANATRMPPQPRRAMHVVAGEHFIVLHVLPNEDWDSSDVARFSATISQYAYSLGEGEGEEWKNA